MDKKKIILIEDDPDARMMLQLSLTEAGYEVIEFDDGINGYVDIFKIKPDLIITDVVLPRMNGNDLFKWVRGTKEGSSIPFIFLTGHHLMKEYIKTLEIDEFFEKPFKTEELLAAVARLIKAREGKLKAKQYVDKFSIGKRTVVDEDPASKGEKLKQCENCKATMAVTNLRCPHCGGMRLVVIEE